MSDIENQVTDLISKMSLDEKIEQMSGENNILDMLVIPFRYNLRTYNAGENKRLGIEAIRFTDGPYGISLNKSTCFPVSIARGAAWDVELEERVADAMGKEGRAQGANFFGGVCINLIRHPGWGRAQESFGEDPHLLGELGVAMVRGMQKHMMACAKHYACNSIEQARFKVNVLADERVLYEIYLPHFKKCVDAGVASIMSAYNKVNGFFCGHNKHLLRDILKDEWGFEGFVISDFMLGVRNSRAAAAGLDIEMPFTLFFGRWLKASVKKGKVTTLEIDEAVRRILRQKLRFKDVGDPAGYDKSLVACKAHTELALEVARKSTVLLKNESQALPLKRDELKKIAVIGELANKANLGDRGSSRVRPPYAVTPLDAIRKSAGNSVEVIYHDGKDLVGAKAAAEGADAVVAVVGLTWHDEGEFIPVLNFGGDREDLDLSKHQQELIAVLAEAGSRVIVVLEGGSAITMQAWKDKVQAILMAWYPGMEGGNAIAEILFGDVNPSGKLPLIFPESTAQLPHFNKKAKSIEYGYYHGYRLLDKQGEKPAFAFGFGLSYTEYEYGNLKLSSNEISADGQIEVAVDVTNTGQVAGEEIVQLYVGYNGSAADRPIRDLKGFGKLRLDPGQTGTLTLSLKAQDLAYYDIESKAWVVEPIEYTIFAGPSSRQEDLALSQNFSISG